MVIVEEAHSESGGAQIVIAAPDALEDTAMSIEPSGELAGPVVTPIDHLVPTQPAAPSAQVLNIVQNSVEVHHTHVHPPPAPTEYLAAALAAQGSVDSKFQVLISELQAKFYAGD